MPQCIAPVYQIIPFKMTICFDIQQDVIVLICWSTFLYNWFDGVIYYTNRPRTLTPTNPNRRGTDLERGYGDVRPWRPLSTPLDLLYSLFTRVSFQAKVSVHKTPLLRKFGNISLYSLHFCPIFLSSQAPEFWKFSAHKPPNFEIFSSHASLSGTNVSSQAPNSGNPGRTPEKKKKKKKKKSWVPQVPNPNPNPR